MVIDEAQPAKCSDLNSHKRGRSPVAYMVLDFSDSRVILRADSGRGLS
jgi:hypothetical protein